MDYTSIMNFLGVRDDPPQELTQQVDSCINELNKVIHPRTTHRLFFIERSPEGIMLSNTSLVLPGKDILNHLADSKLALLFAATIGAEADALIRSAQIDNMARAVILDACASVLVEELCDNTQAELSAEYGCLTSRFSPGYGDLPLDIQAKFLNALDAYRSIGLTVTPTHILVPRKSVTAVIGITDSPEQKKEKCLNCNMSDHCTFRRK